MKAATLAGSLAGALIGVLGAVSMTDNKVAAQGGTAEPDVPEATVGCSNDRVYCTFSYPDGVRCMTIYSPAGDDPRVAAVSCTSFVAPGGFTSYESVRAA